MFVSRLFTGTSFCYHLEHRGAAGMAGLQTDVEMLYPETVVHVGRELKQVIRQYAEVGVEAKRCSYL